jgi:SAM-dependent methyltransferase
MTFRKLNTAWNLGLRGCARIVISRFLTWSGITNRISWQRRNWSAELARETRAKDWTRLGYSWGGDPNNTDDRLGNYARVLELLKSRVGPDSCVVEIGSYGGKWTQHLLLAREVIAVDLFDLSHEVLRRRFHNPGNLRFYKTSGSELAGIAAGTAQCVFTVDSLVRVPRWAIERYLSEIHRVLARGGNAIVHLPCDDLEFCRNARFTSLSRAWIQQALTRAGFSSFELDADTLKHGILVLAQRG